MFVEFRGFALSVPPRELYFAFNILSTCLLGLLIIFQHHLVSKDLLRLHISKIPKPPSSFGQHTCPHNTRKNFPVFLFASRLRNIFLILLIVFVTHRDICSIDMRYNGEFVNIALMRTIWLPIDRYFSYHPSSFFFFSILSNNHVQYCLSSLPCFSGIPKCLIDSWPSLHPNIALMICPANFGPSQVHHQALMKING